MVFDKPRLPREAVAPGISHSWNRCWRGGAGRCALSGPESQSPPEPATREGTSNARHLDLSELRCRPLLRTA